MSYNLFNSGGSNSSQIPTIINRLDNLENLNISNLELLTVQDKDLNNLTTSGKWYADKSYLNSPPLLETQLGDSSHFYQIEVSTIQSSSPNLSGSSVLSQLVIGGFDNTYNVGIPQCWLRFQHSNSNWTDWNHIGGELLKNQKVLCVSILDDTSINFNNFLQTRSNDLSNNENKFAGYDANGKIYKLYKNSNGEIKSEVYLDYVKGLIVLDTSNDGFFKWDGSKWLSISLPKIPDGQVDNSRLFYRLQNERTTQDNLSFIRDNVPELEDGSTLSSDSSKLKIVQISKDASDVIDISFVDFNLDPANLAILQNRVNTLATALSDANNVVGIVPAVANGQAFNTIADAITFFDNVSATDGVTYIIWASILQSGSQVSALWQYQRKDDVNVSTITALSPSILVTTDGSGGTINKVLSPSGVYEYTSDLTWELRAGQSLFSPLQLEETSKTVFPNQIVFFEQNTVSDVNSYGGEFIWTGTANTTANLNTDFTATNWKPVGINKEATISIINDNREDLNEFPHPLSSLTRHTPGVSIMNATLESAYENNDAYRTELLNKYGDGSSLITRPFLRPCNSFSTNFAIGASLPTIKPKHRLNGVVLRVQDNTKKQAVRFIIFNFSTSVVERVINTSDFTDSDFYQDSSGRWFLTLNFTNSEIPENGFTNEVFLYPYAHQNNSPIFHYYGLWQSELDAGMTVRYDSIYNSYGELNGGWINGVNATAGSTIAVANWTNLLGGVAMDLYISRIGYRP